MTSRLVSCALTSLSRRVGQLSLASTTTISTTRCQPISTLIAANSTRNITRLVLPNAVNSLTVPSVSSTSLWGGLGSSLDACSSSSSSPTLQVNRTFATRKKRLAKRQKRRLEAKRLVKLQDASGGQIPTDEGEAAPQHEAWVEFQKSIAVEGFQTGQTTKAKTIQKGESGQKLRDLKRREKLEMRMASKRPEISDVRGGHFPTHRYSDEETERLLAMAYGAIPERAGKRGTRNLKRQKRRWHLVRKIHAKEKYFIKKAHFRNMEARSQRMQELKAIKADAPEARATDREYQLQILRKWTENLAKYDEGYAERELIQAEATVIEQDAKA